MWRRQKAVLLVGVLILVGFFAWPSASPTPVLAQVKIDNLHPVEVFHFSPSAQSVQQAFAEAGRPFYFEDEISVFPDPALGLGGTVTVRRALAVDITDGKKTYTARTWESNVSGLLAEKNIELGSDDQINLALGTALVSSARVNITRVAITTIIQKESIAFGTTKKDDPTLDKGKTKLAKAGVVGQKELAFEVRREDGVEVSRTLKSTTVVKPAENEVIMVGTKPVITGWCKYNDWVLDAAIKNGLDPDALCYRMQKESFGNPNAVGSGIYFGLFQYEAGFWANVSVKAGYSGVSIFDAKAQIYTTAWAWAHGYRGRWPNP